jgi:hypothetical protein
MATTTTNFGWDIPQSTDLVKDGATAIAALGQDIDTALVDLKGGTTGQVLAKASNTDLDYSWTTPQVGDITAVTAGTGISGGGTGGDVTITNSMATAIDAKGDLIAGTGADTFSRIAAGANGEMLVADSTTSTGLRYQSSYAAAKNVLINGNADYWQRGTTSAAIANGTYLADRWKTVLSGTSLNVTYSRDTSVPNGASKYSAKLQQLSSSATSVSEFALRQPMEGGTVYQLIGNQVTVSFWYRSNQTGSHYVRIGASVLTGGTDTTQAFTVNAADTWEKKSLTFAAFASVSAMNLADNAEAAIVDIGIRTFGSGGTETVAANDYFQVTQIQLETGSVATSFSRAGGTFQGELAACQRYYYLHASGTSKMVGNGAYYSASEVDTMIQFPVTMRSAPTIDQTTGTDYYLFYRNGGSDGFNSFTISYASTTGTNLFNAAQVSGTAGQAGQIATNNASTYLGFTAEL